MKINIEEFASNMGLDPKEIRGLYTTFFEEMNTDVKLLRKAYDNSDFDEIKGIMHNVKGVCLNLELLEIGNYAKDIYNEIKEKNYSNLGGFISYFESEIQSISKYVEEYYNQHT